jgi:uncharacterized protein (TIRG00374 family)
VLFSCLLVLTLVLNIVFSFSLSLGKKLRNERLRRILENAKEGFGFFQKNWQLALRFSILLLTGIFISGARLFVCFSSIDLDVVPLQMLIISSLTTFSMVLSLTPANLGIREGIISFAAHLFGIPADKAVLAALIDRGAMVVVTFSFGLIFSRILLSDMKLVEQNIEN